MKTIRTLIVLLLAISGSVWAEKLSTGETAMEFVNKYVHDHTIMVFAKSSCKYCKNSKKIIDKIHKKTSKMGWSARFVYLDYMSTDGPKIHAALVEKTGIQTVPNIFISGEHVGGNTELTEMYKSGDLLKKIREIAAATTA